MKCPKCAHELIRAVYIHSSVDPAKKPDTHGYLCENCQRQFINTGDELHVVNALESLQKLLPPLHEIKDKIEQRELEEDEEFTPRAVLIMWLRQELVMAHVGIPRNHGLEDGLRKYHQRIRRLSWWPWIVQTVRYIIMYY